MDSKYGEDSKGGVRQNSNIYLEIEQYDPTYFRGIVEYLFNLYGAEQSVTCCAEMVRLLHKRNETPMVKDRQRGRSADARSSSTVFFS